MGCSSSKVDNEEGVARCRARKRFIKHAVGSRHAFASAHAHYVQALKASGAAFRQFAEGEQGDQRTRLHSVPSTPQIPSTPQNPSTPLTIKEARPPPPPPMFQTPRPSSPPRHEVRSLSGTDPEPLQLEGSRRPPPSPRPVEQPHSPPAFTVVSQATRDSQEDGWGYYNAPPPPPRQGSSNPPPPPPPPRSSWHNLFLDPFHPVPEVMEFSSPSSPPSPPSELIDKRKTKQKYEATSESKKLKEEEGMPDLEEVEFEGEDEHFRGKEVIVKQAEKPRIPSETHQETAMVEKNMGTAVETRNMETSIAVSKHESIMVEKSMNNEISVHSTSSGRDLLEVLRDVDDYFLKAAESGDAVCRMLEAKKVHYHSSFSDVKGLADHPAKVFNSTFWTRSLSKNSTTNSGLLRDFGTLPADVGVENGGMVGSHASTLDRLFAWEKKLYDEVKAAEVIRVDLEKNYTRLRHQDAKGDDPLAIDKTRANIKVLHTRFMVALQAVDAASSTVHKLRDEELYPQLLDLLQGLTMMWKEMHGCHQAQQAIVEDMKTLSNSAAAGATTSMHRQTTVELASALVKWSSAFSSVITTQKEYLHNLTGWLRLSLIQPDTELREEQSKSGRSKSDRSKSDKSKSEAPKSETKVANTPIYSLCQDWHLALEKLPDKEALDALNGFAGIVSEWVRLQSEELKHKKKAESLERELIKKEQVLEVLERKYVDSTPVSGDKEELVTDSPRRAALNENKSRVDQYRLKVEQEKEMVEKSIQATRAMTLNSTQSALPGVFSAIANFATVAHQTFRDLHAHGVNINLARISG